MAKLTETEKRLRAEQRSRSRVTYKRLARWDTVLSGLASVGLLIWLAVYVREGSLQGALSSIGFWLALSAGLIILVVLIRRFFLSAKVARRS